MAENRHDMDLAFRALIARAALATSNSRTLLFRSQSDRQQRFSRISLA